MRGIALSRPRFAREVVRVLCIGWLALGAMACGQSIQDAPDEAAGAESEAAQKATDGERPDRTASADFSPSVPAIWDVSDPKVELEGREALLDYLNDVRARHKLDPVTWDDTLEKAALSHAEYIMKNKAAIDASGVSIHLEDESLPGYTGETYVTRGEVFGYSGVCSGEVVAFKPTAVGAARSWLESLYHRFPLLDASVVHVGYAELQLDDVKVNVMEVGSNE